MSENMDIVKDSEVLVYKAENNIISDIQNNDILKILNTYGYDEKKLKEFFISERYTATEQHDLNVVFRKMKKNHGIMLLDIVLLLEGYNRIRRIVFFLDGETKQLLKVELSKKHNIKLRENTPLSDFLEM